MGEVYVSTDVETDGPVPGPNSMLSLGSAAIEPSKRIISTFSVNLETLPEATGHPRTMAWWRSQPEAWEACRVNPVPPERAMRSYIGWLNELPGKPVFVAYPAGFDFTFVYWYLMRFTGECPFSYSALDLKTLAMALLGCDYRDAVKRNMPKAWFDTKNHTHVALEDAIEQGLMFCNMLEALKARGTAG